MCYYVEKEEYNKAINYFDAVLPVFLENDLNYQASIAQLSKAEALLAVNPQSNNNIARATKALK